MPRLQVPEVEARRQPLVAPPGKCAAHDWEDHRPLPTYVELHHVIPQAWQKFWWPDWNNGGLDKPRLAPCGEAEMRYQPKEEVWDARLVPLGPTCHRNVHYWLVYFMKVRSAKPVTRPVPRGGDAEKKIAKLAMDRWEEHGGSLDALCDAGLYGYA